LREDVTRIATLIMAAVVFFARESRGWCEAVDVQQEPGKVNVRIEASSDERLLVTIDGKSCHAPCTLMVTPGPHQIITTGSRTLKLDLRVPHRPAVVRLPAENRALFVSGVVLTAAGVAAMPILAVALTLTACSPSMLTSPYQSPGLCRVGAGLTGVLIGIPVLATGVGLLGYWGTHRPTTAVVEVASQDPGSQGLRLVTIGLQRVRNGVAGGLGFVF
jgi:hypothetical protein